MKTAFELKQTNNYDLFTLGINRSVDQRRVASKMRSIERIGLQQPIIVNRRFQVVDGQHRLAALKELGLPVDFLVSYNWKSEEDTAEINTTQDSWNTINWAEYQIKRGNKEIADAMDFANNYVNLTNGKMTLTTALELLCTERSSLITLLKNGNYKMDSDRAHKVFQLLRFFEENPTSMKPYNQKLVRAIKSLHIDREYINRKAFERMVKSQYVWPTYNNEGDMIAYIDSMYKKHLSKSN